MPIKRNSNIQELSRDHHFGLLFCWKIKEGVKKNVSSERIINYIQFFWEGHLKTHFFEEEQQLFQRVRDPLCEKAMEEHLLIKEKMEHLTVANAQHHFLELTELINGHIRFEERVLFPHLELILSEEALKEIGTYLTEAHHLSFKDDYKDEFWVDKNKHME